MVINSCYIKQIFLSEDCIQTLKEKGYEDIVYIPTVSDMIRWFRKEKNIYFDVRHYSLEMNSSWTDVTVTMMGKRGCECSFAGFDEDEVLKEAVEWSVKALL